MKQQVQSFNYEFWHSAQSRFQSQRPRRALLIEILKPWVQVATSDIAFCKMLRRREMNIVFFTHTWVLTLGVQRQGRVNEFSFPVLRWSRVGRLSPRILSRKQQINCLKLKMECVELAFERTHNFSSSPHAYCWYMRDSFVRGTFENIFFISWSTRSDHGLDQLSSVALMVMICNDNF